MSKRPIFPRRVIVLPPSYNRWVQAAANYARCAPETVVCLALRDWLRSPDRADFAASVARSTGVKFPSAESVTKS